MSRVSLLLFALLALTSCERTIDTSNELVKVLVNQTDKKLLYSVTTNVGSGSVVSYGNDMVELNFVRNSTVTLPPIGPYYIDVDGVSVEGEILYNLTDTSLFSYNADWTKWDVYDSLYATKISYKNEGEVMHAKNTATLTFNDTLLSIMTKDSTMLKKFPEYYSKRK